MKTLILKNHNFWTLKTYTILKDHNVLCKIAQGFLLIILLGSEAIKVSFRLHILQRLNHKGGCGQQFSQAHIFWTLMTLNLPKIDMKSSAHILSTKNLKLQVQIEGKCWNQVSMLSYGVLGHRRMLCSTMMTLFSKAHIFWNLMAFNIPKTDMKSSTHILSRKNVKLQMQVEG